MSVKKYFFGKDCVIDRNLLNRQDIDKEIKGKGFEYKKLLFVNQIHSNKIVTIDDEHKIYDIHSLPKADGIVTNLKNVAIAVFTADCAPIFLFDEEKCVIGVVHAGWRGAKSGVVEQAVADMKNLGARNIKAVLGPMIQQNSYEISQEFYDDFLIESLSNKFFFKSCLASNHYLFDLPAYILKKFQAENLVVENLAIDTYKNEKNYFSFRRSVHKKEKDCGRNISVIVM